jgi:hypothetical protein
MDMSEIACEAEIFTAVAEYRLMNAFKECGSNPAGKDKRLFDAAFQRLVLTVGKVVGYVQMQYDHDEEKQRT